MDLKARIFAFREDREKAAAERTLLTEALEYVKAYSEEDNFVFTGLDATDPTAAGAEIDTRIEKLAEENKRLEAEAKAIAEAQAEEEQRVTTAAATLGGIKLPDSPADTPLPPVLYGGSMYDAPKQGIGAWLVDQTGGDINKLIGANPITIPLNEVALGHATNPETGKPIIQADVGTSQISTLRQQLEGLSPFAAANYFSDMLVTKNSDGRGLQWNEDDYSKTFTEPSSGEITTAAEQDPGTLSRQMTPDDGRLFTDVSKRSIRMRSEWRNFIEGKLDEAYKRHHSTHALNLGTNVNTVVGVAAYQFVQNNWNATGSNKRNHPFADNAVLRNGIQAEFFNGGGSSSTTATENSGFISAVHDIIDNIYNRSPNSPKVMAISRKRYGTWRRTTGSATSDAAQLAGGLPGDIEGIPMIPIDIGFPTETTTNNAYSPVAVIASFNGEESWIDLSHAEVIVKDLPETGQVRIIIDQTYGYVWHNSYDYGIIYYKKVS